MQHRKPMLLAAAISAIVVLAGCTPTPSATPTHQALSVGMVSGIVSLKPYPIGDPQLALKRSLFDTLVTLDEKLDPVPSLADSWTVNPDITEVDLTLHDGVTFSDGTPLTADSVVWNLTFAQDPANGLQGAAQLAGAVFTAVDDATVKITLTQSTPQIFALLNNIVILQPDSAAAIDSAPIGTGPFIVDSFDPGNEVDLVPNPTYWGKAPLPSKLTFRTYPDPSSLVAALQSGGVDVSYTVPFSDVSRLSEGTTKTIVVPGAGNFNIMVQSETGPTAVKEVRQALSLALDRKRFADTLLDGVTPPTCEMWPQSSPAYDPDLENCKFDLDKAKQLLVDAGYGDGFDLDMVISRNVVPELADFAQIYQADLATIGVNLKIREVEETEAVRTATARDFPGLLGQRYGFANQDPAFAFVAFPFRATQNAPRFESEEWQSLIKQGQTTTDRDDRMKIYGQIAAYLQDEAFNLPMANQPRAMGMQSDVNGVTIGNGDLAVNLSAGTK